MSFEYRIKFLILISLVLNANSMRSAESMNNEVQFVGNNELECMIINKEYSNNYMYAVSGYNRRFKKANVYWRDVNIWSPFFPSSTKEFTDDNDKQGVWILKPVDDQLNVYFLQNKKYGEYLFGMDKEEFAKKTERKQMESRRLVFTDIPSRIGETFNEKFMWHFKQLKGNAGEYEIRNVRFNERKYMFLNYSKVKLILGNY